MASWEKDWDNSDDAIYDGLDDEQIATAAKRKAMREYMDWSMEVEDAIIKSIGQEEYDAREHWINNPLIKPQSKVHLFEEWEQRIRKEQIERVIKLIEEFIENSDLPEVADRLEWLKDSIKGETNE
jgi:hypothetical protein